MNIIAIEGIARMIVFTVRQAALRLSVLMLAFGALVMPAHAAPPTYTLDSPPPAGASILYCVDTSTGPPFIAYAADATHNCGIGAALPVGAATATKQDTGNTSLSTIATNTTGAATPQLAAGENHAGEVGNNEIAVSVSPTVTASSAYASGNAVGGWMTFANAARVSGASGAPGTSGFVQSVVVAMKSLQTTQIDLLLFISDVTGSSTCTDKSAVAIATADVSKQLPPIHITDWTSEGTPSAGAVTNLASFYALVSGTSLYGCLVTRGTPTYTSTSDPTVILRVGRN